MRTAGHTDEIPEKERIATVEKSARKIGRAVFFSILVTLISFAPILMLTGQEEKLFSPLVLTKTFTMIGSAIVALLIVPMLMRVLLKGKLRPESSNPVNRFFIRLYTPVMKACLRNKWLTLFLTLLLLIFSIPVLITTGSEFMPPLDEGSILFMPVTLPDASNAEVKKVMQVQDKIMSGFPEVANVLGKAGRASTATDNAPMSMIETIILLKPRSEWRAGMTKEKLIAELDKAVEMPGVTNGWTQPIINRINMLSTGIRTDVGVKVFGPNLDSIYSLTRQIEEALTGINGLHDLYAEQLTGGLYLDIKLDRDALAQYDLSAEEVNMVIESALGGMTVGSTVEGRERYSMSVRLAQDFRRSINEIERIPVMSTTAGPVPLSQVADIYVQSGPAMINSENALLRGTVLFNVRGRDMGSVVKDARERIDERFEKLPEGYFIEWSGQYENQIRANNRLRIILPIVFIIICFILYFTFKSWKEAIIVLSSLPVALVGGVYSLWFFDVNFSVAVAVGFIALFGVAIETGILMIIYMNEAIGRGKENAKANNKPYTSEKLDTDVFSGAVMRVRPKMMTVLADIVGLSPVLFATGAGSDVMKPITIPFIFGLVTSTLFVLIVLPVIYNLVKQNELKKRGTVTVLEVEE